MDTNLSLGRTLAISTVLAGILVGTAGCPQKDKDTDAPPPAATTAAPPPVTATPEPPPTATGPTAIAPEGMGTPKPGIEPRVKAELDNRADGVTGTPLAVAGAKASLQTPKEWTQTKGDFTVAAPADKKTQLAAGALAAGEAATAKLGPATSALGLASCEWNPPENVTLGKTKLAAQAADGTCTKGGAPVKAAYVAPQAEGLLVVGSWDAGADSAGVFGSMRSIAKAGGGDGTGIAACCAALAQNAKSAPPEQQGGYQLAIGACNAARNDPNARAVLGTIRGMLRGAAMPSACN